MYLASAALVAGCDAGTSNTGASASVQNQSQASGSLTISPSSASVVEGQSTLFTASGGSGSGYSFSMVSGGSSSGTVSSSGEFTAATNWTGTTYVVLADSAGDEVYATVNISASSTGTGPLMISPSSASVVEGQSYSFSASGGSGSDYQFSISSGDRGVVTSTGDFTAPTNYVGPTTLIVVDGNGNTATATITVTQSSTALNTAPLGTFCGNYDFDAYYLNINSIGCNGVSLQDGICPAGFTFETYVNSDGDYAATCVVTTSGIATPTGSFCGSYVENSSGSVLNNVACNGTSLKNGTCPSGYAFETYFQADGNYAGTCVATTAGAALDSGAFCGSYEKGEAPTPFPSPATESASPAAPAQQATPIRNISRPTETPSTPAY